MQAEVRFGWPSLILNSCFAVDPIYPFNNPAGCYANGQIRAHGDRWREDDCTFCQCINGEPHCVATACGQSCMHPVKVPGECCPVCEGKPCDSNECLAQRIPSRELLPVRTCFSFYFLGRNVCFVLLPVADKFIIQPKFVMRGKCCKFKMRIAWAVLLHCTCACLNILHGTGMLTF